MATHTRREMIASVPTAAWLGAGITGTLFAQASGRGGNAEQGGGAGGSLVQKMLAEAYQGREYKLPALPYPYDALEPHIDAKTMKLHHDTHHQGYVNGLNKAIKKLGEFQAGGELDSDRLAGVQRDLSFNAGGHLLHTVFWATMGSGQDNRPTGEVARALHEQFGSLDTVREVFQKVATTVKGSGWAALMYEPVGDRLLVYQINQHDVHLAPGSVPLLPVDVWEHAYYLKYGPARAEYVKAWWEVVNWSVVDQSYQWIRSRRQEAAMSTAGR